VADRLYERGAELAAIDSAVSALESGRGASLLLEARAGRGKSTLVEYALTAGRTAGARTMLVRARHLTSAAPFEVLRRLLGPAVEELGGVDALVGASRFARPLFVPGAELSNGVDYGCQWLVAWLAEQSPLVLAVDDAHWADSASLRVLLDVQAELSAQPVLLVLASRPVENPAVQSLLAAMGTHPDCMVLTPGTLTRGAVAELIADAVGQQVEEPFVDECVRMSGGNAFYVHELIRQLQEGAQGSRPPLPSRNALSLRRTVTARLGELGVEATQVAQAAAVLGDGCALKVAAELSGLEPSEAVRQAARLEAASILRHGDPVEFVHPLIRRAVEAGMPEVGVGQLHARAARLLWTAGEPPGSVAQHLVVSPGSGDGRVSAFLAVQGREALDAGSPAAALRLLRRAHDEPPPADQRDELLISLARAERAVGELEAAKAHLEEALDSPDRIVAVTAAAELFDVLDAANLFEELAALHARALALLPYGDTEAEARLKAQLLVNEFMAVDPGLEALPPELSEIDASALPTDRDADRYLLVTAAVYERTARGNTSERLVANLRRAVDMLPADTDSLTDWDVRTALVASTFIGDQELEESSAMLDLVAPVVVRLSGTAPDLQAELDHRRLLHQLATGSFEDAMAGLELTEKFTARHGLVGFEGHHRFVRGAIALERGDYALAAQMLTERIGDDTVLPALGAILAGRPADALAILAPLELSPEPEAPIRPIEVEMEVHLIASHAHELLGDRAEAAVQAERELAVRRRYGAPSKLALALRRSASFLPARESLECLEEAMALVGDTPRRPLRARVLASYGAALRRAGRVDEARSALYEAADLAEEMGMQRVRDRARRELVDAGGRPRRERLRGPASLTTSQAEVAGLAADGLTNREIAERLFVTIKTVETHLMAVYRKLGIRHRDELAPILGREPLTAVAAMGGVRAP
jgi:DNA-binding CsgD family transcriptional regulator